MCEPLRDVGSTLTRLIRLLYEDAHIKHTCAITSITHDVWSAILVVSQTQKIVAGVNACVPGVNTRAGENPV